MVVNKTIKTLIIGQNKIGDIGINTIFKALSKNSTLQSLNISNKSIQYIFIEGNKASENVLDKIDIEKYNLKELKK